MAQTSTVKAELAEAISAMNSGLANSTEAGKFFLVGCTFSGNDFRALKTFLSDYFGQRGGSQDSLCQGCCRQWGRQVMTGN